MLRLTDLGSSRNVSQDHVCREPCSLVSTSDDFAIIVGAISLSLASLVEISLSISRGFLRARRLSAKFLRSIFSVQDLP